jgi:hypothetical protein
VASELISKAKARKILSDMPKVNAMYEATLLKNEVETRMAKWK